jgi:hypothetical protein
VAPGPAFDTNIIAPPPLGPAFVPILPLPPPLPPLPIASFSR